MHVRTIIFYKKASIQFICNQINWFRRLEVVKWHWLQFACCNVFDQITNLLSSNLRYIKINSNWMKNSTVLCKSSQNITHRCVLYLKTTVSSRQVCDGMSRRKFAQFFLSVPLYLPNIFVKFLFFIYFLLVWTFKSWKLITNEKINKLKIIK